MADIKNIYATNADAYFDLQDQYALQLKKGRYTNIENNDLNKCKTPGTYSVNNINSLSNNPTDEAGILIISDNVTDGSLTQTWVSQSLTNSFIYIRSFYNNNWSDWVNLKPKDNDSYSIKSSTSAGFSAVYELLKNGESIDDSATIAIPIAEEISVPSYNIVKTSSNTYNLTKNQANIGDTITIPTQDTYSIEQTTAASGYSAAYTLTKNNTEIGTTISIPEVPAQDTYKITKQTTPTSGYLATYSLTKNDTTASVGTVIDIPKYSIVKQTTANSGFATTYRLTQNGISTGTAIDIPLSNSDSYSITKDDSNDTYEAVYHLIKNGTNEGVDINIPFNSFVRPEDFPDSDNPIQDAVDAAAELGKTVLLSGTYTVGRDKEDPLHKAKTINLPDGTTIIGINNATIIAEPYLLRDSVLYPNLNPSNGDMIIGINATTIFNMGSNCYISNIKFDGGRPEGISRSNVRLDYEKYIMQEGVNAIEPSSTQLNTFRTREDIIPSPLIKITAGHENITFYNCDFINFDTNHTDIFTETDIINGTEITCSGSYYWSLMGARYSNNITLKNCSFEDIFKECLVISHCENITIKNCIFDTKGPSPISYSIIGLFFTNQTLISDCRLILNKDNLNSIINAMGNNTIIENCYIEGIGSKYGIDYGNETGIEDASFNNLTIQNNYIHAHIRPYQTTNSHFQARFNNLKIINNTIRCSDLPSPSLDGASWSGVVQIDGSHNEQIIIKNNRFIGHTDRSSLHPAIHINGSSVNLEIDNNYFEDITGFLIRGGPSNITVSYCTFGGHVFRINHTGDTQTYTFDQCRTYDDLGRCVSTAENLTITFTNSNLMTNYTYGGSGYTINTTGSSLVNRIRIPTT